MASREFIHNGKIVVYHLENSTVPELEAWVELILQTAREWEKGKTYCALHDFSKFSRFTAEMRRQAERASADVASLKMGQSFSAVVTRPNVIAQVAKTFIEWKLRFNNQHTVRRLFFDMDQAIAWLIEAESQHGQS